MADAKLCESCKAFLAGTLKPGGYDYYDHHDTQESCKIATELGCEICTRLHAEYLVRMSDPVQKSPVDGLEHTMVIRRDEDQAGMYLPYLAYDFTCFKSKLGACRIGLLLKPITGDHSRVPRSIISRSTGDDDAMAYLKNEYETCLAGHEDCSKRAITTCSLPTRLVNVGVAAEPFVRLCGSGDLASATTYAVLSHCWGDVQPLTLTRASATQLYHGVEVSTLPLTFQHAVLVTRKLNLRYLWIDSLCIFQDDTRDWLEQSSCMRDIYRNAAFCIAATASQNGDEGLFYAWDQPAQFLVKIEERSTTPGVHEAILEPGLYSGSIDPVHPNLAIELAPLNKRAWVAQERYLSSRILHFTRHMLFWECQSSFACETHPDFKRHPGRGPGGGNLKQIAGGIPRSPTQVSAHTRDLIYDAWDQFRHFYSQCNITNVSDILVALRGVAHDVSELLDDHLIFGMWKHRMIQEMAWLALEHQDGCTEWCAPTWSWANSQNVVSSSSRLEGFKELVEIVGYPTETNSATNWQLHTIILRCRLMMVRVEFEDLVGRKFTYMTFNETVTCKNGREAQCFLDDWFALDRSKQTLLHYHFLILGYWGQDDDCNLHGLLLIPNTERGSDLYHRIGILRLFKYPRSLKEPEPAVSDVLGIYETTKDQEIRLV